MWHIVYILTAYMHLGRCKTFAHPDSRFKEQKAIVFFFPRRPKSSYFFPFHPVWFCLVLQSCWDAFIELCPRNSCYIELEMTDVKVVASPNYCCGRQPGLQGCQSELARAGLKLSSHSFSLALHIRSLVLCRSCVLAGASTRKETHALLHARNLNLRASVPSSNVHTQFALAGWVTDCGAKNDLQLGIKTDTSHNIKFARISVSPVEWKAMKAL